MFNGSGNSEVYVSKNLNNNNDMNCNDDRLLCASATTTETNISSTAYLTTTDYITFGFFAVAAGSLPSARCTGTLTLLQRTL